MRYPCRLEVQGGPGRHYARCGSELETAQHAYYCERVRPFWDHVGEWTACTEPKQLMLLDVGYVVDNVLPPFLGEKRVAFFEILPNLNGDLDDAKQGIVRRCKLFSL